jgi:transposase
LLSFRLLLREILGLSLEEQTPDHSTLSKTRRLMNLGTHKAVFRWVLRRLAAEGLLSGRTLGADGKTLEADSALKSLVRRDNGASYDERFAGLMKTKDIEEPAPAERQRFNRKRKKSLSNRDWMNPHDPEAQITKKRKDGRTHPADKTEHTVDLDIRSVVALTVQPGDRRDTASRAPTLTEAGCAMTEMAGQPAQAGAVGAVETVSKAGVERVVADKGHHSKQTLRDLTEVGVRTLIAEPEWKRQKWNGRSAAQAAVHANRRRLDTKMAKALMRRRGELIDRGFTHLYDTGGIRRPHLRGNDNIAIRAKVHAESSAGSIRS